MTRTFILAFAFALCAPTLALAEKDHPRRNEVSDRTETQNNRIREGREDGTLTKDQAKDLHANEKSTRAEERSMAAADGGHITKADKKALNQKEKAAGEEIKADNKATRKANKQ